MTSGLAALEARLADELAFLQLPAPRWTPALEHDGAPVADAVSYTHLTLPTTERV